MPQPPEYERQYSFKDFQESNPTDPLPATGHETELNAVKVTLDAILANLKLIQRDDGALANQSVGEDQLQASLRVGINPAVMWQTGVVYAVNDTVVYSDSGAGRTELWRAVEAHTSTADFDVDSLTSGYWIKMADLSSLSLDAASTDYDNATSGLVATDVQAAIDELDAALDALDATIVSRVATTTGISSKTVSASVNVLFTNGYAAENDGGAAQFKRVGAEPSHDLKAQSADGAWWEFVAPFGTATVTQAGADGAGDDTAAFTGVLGAVNRALVPLDTYTITGLTLANGEVIQGESQRTASTLAYGGTGNAISTPNLGPFNWTFDNKLEDFLLTQTGPLQGTGVFLQDSAGAELRKMRIEGFSTGVKFHNVVGNHLEKAAVSTNGVAFDFDGTGSDSINLLEMYRVISNGNTTVFQNNSGRVTALHVTEGDFETNTNFITGSNPFISPVFRNCWLEGNTNFSLGETRNAVFDTCFVVDDTPTVTGGYNTVWRDVTVEGEDNFPQFYTPTEVSFVDAIGFNWDDNTGAHGLKLTMPKVGHGSTPVDKDYSQGRAQSMLIGEMGGTLFGYSQPLQNYNTVNVSTASWTGFSDAVVTSGQADPFGGTAAFKVEVGATDDFMTRSAVTVPASPEWVVWQITFKMVAEDEEWGLWSEGPTTSKRNYWKVGDTEWRVAHMLVKKGSDTSVTPRIILPASGIIIHRLCLYTGTQLKPMLLEGQNIPEPFIMEFGRVKTFGSAAPTSGTWAVGDVVIDTAPSAGGTMGWVCTTAGTPGTWKTFGGQSRGTAATLPSAATADFTGMPAGLDRIEIMLDAVSTNGTSPLLLQIGDAGGVETTGYDSSASDGADADTSTAGFLLVPDTLAATEWNGTITLTRLSGNKWTAKAMLNQGGAALVAISAGVKQLSGELDRVRLTTVGGSDNFDAGSWNWQGA